ncbi:hypothetical protein IQ06DRAFT_154700 [Phaeosphaeriaceae sp. SRC1lsM3a]|nr:hypothetical protein IQ06DRAFT_154700 [Stagonospora sp. SRC1lsM3a]
MRPRFAPHLSLRERYNLPQRIATSHLCPPLLFVLHQNPLLPVAATLDSGRWECPSILNLHIRGRAPFTACTPCQLKQNFIPAMMVFTKPCSVPSVVPSGPSQFACLYAVHVGLPARHTALTATDDQTLIGYLSSSYRSNFLIKAVFSTLPSSQFNTFLISKPFPTTI